MTTFTASPEAPILDAAGGPGLSMQSVAQLVAGTLCGVHRVGGQFVRVNATVGDDGYIDVDVTQIVSPPRTPPSGYCFTPLLRSPSRPDPFPGRETWHEPGNALTGTTG
ncbi:MAG: hypothetical protein LC721_07245 [Actinobacteria bacterium]|nr:hypothetical protein [Actinomycetota bacterium]